jgi:glycosyltransferase involved in cell wall biosynthesis
MCHRLSVLQRSHDLEQAVRGLIERLASLGGTWLIVGDGSTDGSREIAPRSGRIETPGPGYRQRGRGFALRTGIAAARGDLIVTTEIDLSWGDTIVHDCRRAAEWPDVDIVVASPPGRRFVLDAPPSVCALSRMGNRVIRAACQRGHHEHRNDARLPARRRLSLP